MHQALSSHTFAVQVFLAGILLASWWSLQVESHPIVERATMSGSKVLISTLFDMRKLNNPCSLDSPAANPGPQDCGNSRVLPYAQLANREVTSLQNKLAGTCNGMTLTSDLPLPAISDSMSESAKIKKMYESLVHHAAYVGAMTTLRERHSSSVLPPVDDYKKCVSALQNLQCHLFCRASMSSEELQALVTRVGAIEITTHENDSGRNMFDCVVVNSTITLLGIISNQFQA